MPTSVPQRATSSGPRSMRTPSSSSMSAPPLFDDAARLPCLTTGIPAATTIAAMVERFTVFETNPAGADDVDGAGADDVGRNPARVAPWCRLFAHPRRPTDASSSSTRRRPRPEPGWPLPHDLVHRPEAPHAGSQLRIRSSIGPGPAATMTRGVLLGSASRVDRRTDTPVTDGVRGGWGQLTKLSWTNSAPWELYLDNYKSVIYFSLTRRCRHLRNCDNVPRCVR